MPEHGLNDAFDGVDNSCFRNASGGEGGMNLGELVRVDGGISRTLGLKQKPAVVAQNPEKLRKASDFRAAAIPSWA